MLQSTPTEGKSLSILLDMPLAFLGFALWRAWVSLSYANPPLPLPVNEAVGHFLYDVFLAIFALAIALLSKQIAPLAGRRATYPAIALLLGLSSAANVIALDNPALAQTLALPAAVAAGAGSALLILLWCEIYSCLNPIRAALYYALSFMGGVALTYLLEGFRDGYLYGALVALPLLSAALAHRAYGRYIPDAERPQHAARRLVPWKFFLVLALFDVASGYCVAQIDPALGGVIGPHSTLTTLAAALVLFVWVWYFSDRFPLSTLYRTPIILICFGMLLPPLFGLGGTAVGSFLVVFGSTLFGALVFLFFCDICKRFGVSALLLFGIEEALVMLSWVGNTEARLLSNTGILGEAGPAVGAVILVVLIAVVAALVLNEREIGERWGIVFLGKRPPEETERTRLTRRCAELAEERHLTARETEVLELLARGKSLSGVAQELVIAEGTAKAHTRHIYEKVGINTRQELLDLLVVEQR
ncbi:response regulator transcription factor [uncultured Adlercreutzia sp.]|uniref:response regulator transcription factor n=1 Tax=uncultured Adlercreutzia sp. TaxID=875803 RepID=UPI0025DC1D8E|nr:helix-turn-helix transcriptional regulator [uncultured Adlercreutzia sp.]MCI9261841.1 helix-turn-helix transcriptional regulator [Eggerthellaceae bacterium]